MTEWRILGKLCINLKTVSSSLPLYPYHSYTLGLFVWPEDSGCRFLRNICNNLPDQPWEAQVVTKVGVLVVQIIMPCVWVWLQTGFGLVIGFIEHLQIVITSNYSAIANSHTLQFITALISLLSLLYLHRLSPGNGFQRCSFLSFCVHVLTGRRLSHN
jgi:hypothetical protein